MKNSGSFHISAQNTNCGHLLELPWWGGSFQYPQSMFLSRNKKINVYPSKPQFYCIKVGFKGIKTIYRGVFVMVVLLVVVNIFKLLLWSRWADWSQTAYGASMGQKNENLFGLAVGGGGGLGNMTKMAAMPYMIIFFLLWNQWANGLGMLHWGHGSIIV